MSKRWLAVTLKGRSKKPGDRIESLLAYLKSKSLKVASIAREGTQIFMQVKTNMSPSDLQTIANKHPDVGVSFAN